MIDPRVTIMSRCLFLLTTSLLCCHVSLGQALLQADLPAWMFKVLEVKLPADHVEVQLDPKSIHGVNRFIGNYEGTAVVPYAYRRLAFGGWADSTRSVFVANALGQNKTVTIVLIDRAAGKLLITRDLAGGRVTQLTDFPPAMSHDEPIWPDERAVVRTNGEQTLIGHLGHEVLLVHKDTIRVLSADELPSPFADVLGIMGLLHGDVEPLSALFFTGPTFPLRYDHKRLQAEVIYAIEGPRPLPNYHVKDLGTIERVVMSSSEGLLQRWQRLERSDKSSRGAIDMDMDVAVPPSPGPTAERIFTSSEVEVTPEFPGGERSLTAYIARMVVYPEMEKAKRISGKVFVGFSVSSDGMIRDVKLDRGVTQGLDAEALRVVRNMPKWKPGLLNGRSVEVQMTVPIEFKLD